MKPINVPLSPSLREFLADRHILPKTATFLRVKTIQLPSDLSVSHWTRHLVRPNGTMVLTSLGYMSYSHTDILTMKAGAYCSIARDAKIMGQSHPLDRVSTHPLSYGGYYMGLAKEAGVNDYRPYAPLAAKDPTVVVGNDVWIGGGAILSRGITIGTGAVIASHAIVTKDVPPYAIVGGVPAKIIRFRFPDDMIARLLASRWWEYDLATLSSFSFTDPDAFCQAFDAAKGKLTPRAEEIVTAADLRQFA